MTPAEITDDDIAVAAKDLRAKGTPFAIATVVRTLGTTAAKPGSKALLDSNGDIQNGWVGGGCVRAALAKAVVRAMRDGAPQLISLHPQQLLEEKNIQAGDEIEGVRFGRNGCPSKGSMDIFVEPIMPLPELMIYGASPVSQSLANFADLLQWTVQSTDAEDAIAPLTSGGRRMIVVSSQGKNDLGCLTSALNTDAEFIAFVGSEKKFAALTEKLVEKGFSRKRIEKIRAPAGVSIHAVTPEEIALSIMAQLTQTRRANQRDGDEL